MGFFDRTKAMSHRRSGHRLNMQGDLEGAIREYEAALELNPRDFAAAGSIGEAYVELGDLRRAVEYFKRSIEIKPDHPRARGDLNMAALRLGMFEDAEREARQTIALSPNYWMPNFVLAVICEMRGDYREAARWWDISATCFTDTPGIQWRTALRGARNAVRCYLLSDDLDTAVEKARQYSRQVDSFGEFTELARALETGKLVVSGQSILLSDSDMVTFVRLPQWQGGLVIDWKGQLEAGAPMPPEDWTSG